MSLRRAISVGLYGASLPAGYGTAPGVYIAAGSITDMPIGGLNIDDDGGCYDFEFQISNPTGTGTSLRFIVNGDTTDANYYITRFRHDTAIFSTSPRTNANTVTNHVASGTTVGWGKIIREKSTGKTKIFMWASELSGSSLDMRILCMHYNVNANVTSLQISTSAASSIGVSSSFRVWKRGNPTQRGAQIGYAKTESTTTASDTTSGFPYDNTIPQNSEGVAYASLDTTYTPRDAASILEVEVNIPFISASAAKIVAFALFRDSGTDAIGFAAASVSAGDYKQGVTIKAYVAAGTASATTFKLRWGGYGSGTAYLLRDLTTAALWGAVNKATMTVKEIQQ